ncbi:MAG: signal peptide peptidase SppA, partial [Cyanobacteria bacterium J06632_22]
MRDFIKYAAASAVGTLVGLFTLIALLGIGAVGMVGVLLASNSTESEPELDEASVLVFDLSTDIMDAVPYSGAGVVFEEAFYGGSYEAISLYSAISAIEAAAADEDITGIFLTGNTFEGFATLKEIRDALVAFKETSGKPIIAYETGWGERDYYLTSVADKVYLNPAGLMELNGFRAEIQFLAGALEKYGVGVQVLRVGRYKSAVEPFIRESSSPEEKQQTEALLTDLWQDFLTTASANRELTPEALQTIADGGGLLMAADAKAAGLVDEVAFFDEVREELRSLGDESEGDGDETEPDTEAEPETNDDTVAEADDTGTEDTGTEDTDSEAAEFDEDDVDTEDDFDPDEADSFPSVTLQAYSRMTAAESGGFFQDDTVAVVYAEGEIVSGEGVSPGLITSEGLVKTLRSVRRDNDVDAVVLRVNSPGGSALASEVIAREVSLLAEKKPLVISMGDYAASGGYMIAAPGSKIFASPSTITGSIGVYGLLLNFQEIANRNGITWDVMKTAKFADIGTVSRPQSEEELQIQQDFVNDLYDRFIGLVADARKVDKADINEVAQGRVWSGSDALAVDLVDEIGGLNDAIAAAAEAAELEDWQVQEFPRPQSLEEQIIESLFGSGVVSRLPWAKDPVSEELLKLREDLSILNTHVNAVGVIER